MSQTFQSTAKYEEQFDRLAGQIAAASADWSAKNGGDLSYYSHAMPAEVGTLVAQAARMGYLYDEDGHQIWDEQTYSATSNLTGERYLHCGSKTYRIHDNPNLNELIMEEPPRLASVKTNDLYFLSAPHGMGQPVPPHRPPEPVKPTLNLFWKAVNGLCRIFTLGRKGLPSVNRYEEQLAQKETYRQEQQQYRQAYGLYTQMQSCQAQSSVLNESQPLANGMTALQKAIEHSINDDLTNSKQREGLAVLSDALKVLQTRVGTGMVPREYGYSALHRLTPFFLSENADPRNLAELMQGHSTERVVDFLQGLGDKQRTVDDLLWELQRPEFPTRPELQEDEQKEPPDLQEDGPQLPPDYSDEELKEVYGENEPLQQNRPGQPHDVRQDRPSKVLAAMKNYGLIGALPEELVAPTKNLFKTYSDLIKAAKQGTFPKDTLNRITDRLAPFFLGKDPQPVPLLWALKGCRLPQVTAALENMAARQMTAAEWITAMKDPAARKVLITPNVPKPADQPAPQNQVQPGGNQPVPAGPHSGTNS